MSGLVDFIQGEMKKARIEALKSCTHEQICDVLDEQQQQITELIKLLKLSSDTIKASVAETGISDMRRSYRNDLHEKIEKKLKEMGSNG